MPKAARRERGPLRTPLPEPATTFFGRDHELGVLRGWLEGDRRLVTLLGPGGVGKTRLALRFAAGLRGSRGAADPEVVFCELSGAVSLQDFCSSLALALGTRLRSPNDEAAVAELAGALRARAPTLLVLDNLEQLAADTTTVLSDLLAAAPEVRILATSRVRLRVSGEAVIDLDPLPVPGPAVELFLERARRVAPGWGEAPGDAARVAAIVRRLDGFPLAIELCATRCRVLDPATLLARLERGFDALGDGPRDVTERHRTLARAIDWSVQSLPGAPRSAFEQAAVFAGGFDLQAAEAVLDLGGASVLDALAHLVDASLLRATDGRFSMYSAIRGHAARSLAEAGTAAAAVEARHARYYVDFGERVVEGTSEADRAALLLERDNLTSAYARAVARPGDAASVAIALRAALVLDELLEGIGPLRELFERIDAPLRAAEKIGAARELLARALRARGRAQLIGRTKAAAADLERAVAAAAAGGDRATEARACASLGVAYRVLRRIEEARAMGERAVAICTTIDAPRVEARARNALGGLLYETGELDRAAVLLAEAEALARRTGDRWTEALTVAGRAHLLQEQAELADALRTFARASALFEATGDERNATVCRGYGASARHERGEHAPAYEAYSAATARLAQLGDARFEGLFLACACAALAQLGRMDDARAAADASERVVEALGDPALLLVVQLHRLHIDVAEQRGSEALARSRALTEKSPLVAQSDDIRFALRILHRAIATGATSRTPESGRAPLRIAIGSRWFEPPRGPRTPLGRKRALWLILHALADARLRSPGSVLSSEALVAAGWPDERVLPTAGLHRVRVAVATLRNSGLRGILLSRSGGYVLDPTAPVELVPD